MMDIMLCQTPGAAPTGLEGLSISVVALRRLKLLLLPNDIRWRMEDGLRSSSASCGACGCGDDSATVTELGDRWTSFSLSALKKFESVHCGQ